MAINWDKVINGMQVTMYAAVLSILGVSVIALLLFDSVVGTGVNYSLTQGNLIASLGISMTTGLLTAVAFMSYMAFHRGYGTGGKILLGVTAIFMLIDIYFDSLTADVLYFGEFVSITFANLREINMRVLFFYRILIGGLSMVGEVMAMAIIVGMPELKAFIMNSIPKSHTPARPAREYNAVMDTLPRSAHYAGKER